MHESEHVVRGPTSVHESEHVVRGLLMHESVHESEHVVRGLPRCMSLST